MSTIIRDFEIGAGENREISMVGKFFMILESSYDCDIDLTYAKSTVSKLRGVDQTVSVGPISGKGFQGFFIKSTGGQAQTVKLCISDDPVAFRRLAGQVTMTKGTTFSGVADLVVVAATDTQVVAGDSTRKKIHIFNDGANPIRIGGNASVGAAQGMPVYPGMGITLETTGQIRGYSALGTTLSIAIERD